MDSYQEALGMRFDCFGREVENDGGFHMFRKEEITLERAKLLTKNIARTQEHKNTTWRTTSTFHELNICYT